MRVLVRIAALALLTLAGVPPSAALAAGAEPVRATADNGEKVLLHPNGRWEYVDKGRAAEARKVAEQFPENQGCPPGSQGGFFGVGRCIPPGDKDYNRGSLIKR
jgi:hypothetical protein